MPGLVPGIHVFRARVKSKTWMAGTTLAAAAARPAMTMLVGGGRLRVPWLEGRARAIEEEADAQEGNADPHSRRAGCGRSVVGVRAADRARARHDREARRQHALGQIARGQRAPDRADR